MNFYSKRRKNWGGRKKRSTRKSYGTRMRGGSTYDLAHNEYIRKQNSLLKSMWDTKNVKRNLLPTPVVDNRSLIEEAKIKFKAGYESLLVSSGQGVNSTSSIPGAEYLTNKQ
jgi:hypothetical protein